MTILYNCRHDGDQYRISKFDDDMNVESSYLCTLEECECPRGPHHTCRHRQMLPKFIAREHVGDEWFFDFDRGGWVQGEALYGISPAITQGAFDLPEGITAIVMDSPDKVVDVHNAIAEAVGEISTAIEKALNETGYVKEPPSPTHMKRRF